MLRKLLGLFKKKDGAKAPAVAAGSDEEKKLAKSREKLQKRIRGFHMIPQEVGEGSWLNYSLSGYYGRKLQWVSRELDPEGKPVSVRQPREQTEKLPHDHPFYAAGKRYRDLEQLRAVNCGDWWYQDIYGRPVFYFIERFPCFDSYDYATEKRFYRWYFILDDGKLTRVHHTDTCEWIYVTEDVESIEGDCWKGMQEADFLR